MEQNIFSSDPNISDVNILDGQSPVSGHQWEEAVSAPLLSWLRRNPSTSSSTGSLWLGRDKGGKVPPGVTQSKG